MCIRDRPVAKAEPKVVKNSRPAAKKPETNWAKGKTKLGTAGAGHKDDLKVVNGIGPVMENTLNGFGIQSWEQLAAFTKQDVNKVNDAIETFPGRIERDEWVRQAKGLVKKFPLNVNKYDRPTRETFLNESASA